MPIPSFFTPPRVVASVEQIRASLAAAREALPTLQQETVAAGMALAAELALDPSRQRIHARDQGMDLGALQRANSEALAKLRDQQDRITAMEAALPFAVERERREQAAATVKSDNMVRENRLRAIDKRKHELVRDAQAVATCFENLRNRRRSLASGLAELEIKGVDIDQFMRETFAQVFSASAYQWKQLPLEGFANNVAGRIDHAKAELEATPKRSVEDELADMDANDAWQARLAAKQAADSGRPIPAENVEALPPGMTRHAWSDVGGLVVGKAPPPKPPSGQVEPEMTRGPDGQPMLLGEHPVCRSPGGNRRGGPQTRQTRTPPMMPPREYHCRPCFRQRAWSRRASPSRSRRSRHRQPGLSRDRRQVSQASARR